MKVQEVDRTQSVESVLSSITVDFISEYYRDTDRWKYSNGIRLNELTGFYVEYRDINRLSIIHILDIDITVYGGLP